MVVHRIAKELVPRLLRPVAAMLLAALIVCPAAHAVTFVTVDNHPSPVTLTLGETVTIRFDVSKPGSNAQVTLVRDLARTGRFDSSYPFATTTQGVDGANDADPDPAKVAFPLALSNSWPAGPYLLRLVEVANSTEVILPVTLSPRSEPQAISGRVVVVSASSPGGTPPPDAIVWAATDPVTLVASASIRPDGSYTLPVPPGTYLLFAEWFGHLRSQRQSVAIVAGQQITGVDLALLQGEEVSGRVMNGNDPAADTIVQAVGPGGATFATRTFRDGSYTLALPTGSYTVSAGGLTEPVIVADQPLDGVDFPPPAASSTPSAGTIVTVAGNGIPGFGGDGRRAAAARQPSPQGLALDRAGNLFIADFNTLRVRKIDAATGIITTVAGSAPIEILRGLSPMQNLRGFRGDGGPAIQALFTDPQFVAADGAGNLYIADTSNSRVRKVGPDGILTTVAGTGEPDARADGSVGDGGRAEAAVVRPHGVAVDREGNLYLTHARALRVRKVTREGIISTVAGGGNQPLTDGASATAVALNFPVGLAVDRAGNLYITDQGLNRILKVTPAGIISTVAGTGKGGFSGDGGPATQAEVLFPRGIAVDSAGNIFFTDNGNHRVRKISPDGIISTVAGSGPAGVGSAGTFAGDGGPATDARLRGPFGIAIDAAGNVLFADQGNRRIRQVIGIAAPGLVGGQ